MFKLVCIVIGYFIGCIQSAYIVGKFNHKDIRKYGSGNLGTTNALRVLGKKAGFVTFVCDIMKAVIAFVICYNIFGKNVEAGVYAGLGVVLGHDFPFYLGFKGGKGIAATIGLVLCLAVTVSPYIALVSFVIGIIGVALKGYVSMGSICFICLVPVMCYFMHADVEITIITAFLAALALYQHRSNIVRIVSGNENTLYKKK